MTAKETKQKRLMYKGKPLVRSGNTIYFGNMADPYIALLQIIETKPMSDIKMASKVSVQILSTDPDLELPKRIYKHTDTPKANLYQALSIASIWLERALEDSGKGAV